MESEFLIIMNIFKNLRIVTRGKEKVKTRLLHILLNRLSGLSLVPERFQELSRHLNVKSLPCNQQTLTTPDSPGLTALLTASTLSPWSTSVAPSSSRAAPSSTSRSPMFSFHEHKADKITMKLRSTVFLKTFQEITSLTSSFSDLDVVMISVSINDCCTKVRYIPARPEAPDLNNFAHILQDMIVSTNTHCNVNPTGGKRRLM